MPPPRIPKGLPQPVRKERAGMSPSHLAMVRACGCVICPDGGHVVQAHHLLRTGDPTQRGTGRKPADKHAVPLCVAHHDLLHRNGDEDSYLSAHGIDGRALASALWSARGDQEAMERIVFRFRQEAALKLRGAA